MGTTLFNSKNHNFHFTGLKNPEEAIKNISVNQLSREDIVNCENLDDLKKTASSTNQIYVIRVLGGDPEEVRGDVVWCEYKSPEAYYIAIGSSSVKIYFKEANGELSLTYIGNLSEFNL